MKKWLYLLLIGLAALIGARLVPKYNQQNTPPAQTQRPVQRIISMAPNLTEILFALGLDEKIIAVTQFSNFPPQAQQKPKVGSFWQPDIEAVIAAKPDLVVTLRFEQQENLAKKLERIGCQCLTLKIEKIPDLFDAIEKIGLATATQNQAKQLTGTIRKKLDDISVLIGTSERTKVLYIVQREPLRVAGTDTFINRMITLAGGQNAIGDTVQKYPPIGAEQVIACNAEVIIEPAMGKSNVDKLHQAAIEYYSRFKTLPAVKDRRIYVIDDDTVSQLGPRMHMGVETIARCLRPELFEK